MSRMIQVNRRFKAAPVGVTMVHKEVGLTDRCFIDIATALLDLVGRDLPDAVIGFVTVTIDVRADEPLTGQGGAGGAASPPA